MPGRRPSPFGGIHLGPDVVNPTYDPALLDAIEGLEFDNWETDVWRQTIGDTDPLRPNARGARWNPPNVDALYCSLSSAGAAAELSSMISRQPVKIRKSLRTLKIRIRLSRVADLRGCAILEPFGYPPSSFVGEDWSAPQEVGGAAAWLGIGGLIVPSVRHADGNVVVFVNCLGPNDTLKPLPHPSTNDV